MGDDDDDFSFLEALQGASDLGRHGRGGPQGRRHDALVRILNRTHGFQS
jgi:hypothetical protein